MTEAEKRMKQYTNEVERRLHLPRSVKRRVMTDFISSIQGRREAGQSDEQIFAELGPAQKAADDLNAQMQDFAEHRSPWRWVCFGVSVISAIVLAARLLSAYVIRSGVGIIGGADGPTAIFVTSPISGPTWKLLFWALLLVLGLLGFWQISRRRKSE